MTTMQEIFGDVIYSYSRAQAIEDGVLIDVSETAREAGIKFPVALTSAVWDEYVEVPFGLRGHQDPKGRLWDIIFMFRMSVKNNGEQNPLRFCLYVRNTHRETLDNRDKIELKAHCGPGDTAEPVITIMLPHED